MNLKNKFKKFASALFAGLMVIGSAGSAVVPVHAENNDTDRLKTRIYLAFDENVEVRDPDLDGIFDDIPDIKIANIEGDTDAIKPQEINSDGALKLSLMTGNKATDPVRTYEGKAYFDIDAKAGDKITFEVTQDASKLKHVDGLKFMYNAGNGYGENDQPEKRTVTISVIQNDSGNLVVNCTQDAGKSLSLVQPVMNSDGNFEGYTILPYFSSVYSNAGLSQLNLHVGKDATFNNVQPGYPVGGTSDPYRVFLQHASGDVDLTKYIPSRYGYEFMGWYTDEQLTKKADDQYHIKGVEGNDIYAKWDKITITLKFDADGGTTPTNTDGGTYKLTVDDELKNNLDDIQTKRDGYLFNGWEPENPDDLIFWPLTNDVAAHDVKFQLSHFVQNGDHDKTVNFKAVWQKQGKIHFETNGGSEIADAETGLYGEGNGVNFDVFVPEKEGYNFEGWYADKELTIPADDAVKYETIQKGYQKGFKAMPDDMTVYAKWGHDVYVRFESNGGEKIDPVNLGKGGGRLALNNTYNLNLYNINVHPDQKKGYTFFGWCTDKECKNVLECSKEYTFTEDTTLYAKWVKNPEIKPTLKAEEPVIKPGSTAKFDLEFKVPELSNYNSNKNAWVDFYPAILVSFDHITGLDTKDIDPDPCVGGVWSNKQAETIEAFWKDAEIYVDGEKLEGEKRDNIGFGYQAAETEEDKHAGHGLSLAVFHAGDADYDFSGKDIKIVMPYKVTEKDLDENGEFKVNAWIDTTWGKADDDKTSAEATSNETAAVKPSTSSNMIETSETVYHWHDMWKGNASVTLSKPTVTVRKITDSGTALAGATLAVYDTNGKEIDSWTTDGSNHVIDSKLLVDGETYTIKETKVPDGYRKADDITFKYSASADDFDLSMIDPAKPKPQEIHIPPTVTVNKVDENGNPVKGAELTLYKGMFLEDKNLQPVATWTTDGTAKVFKDLEIGQKYSIVETKVPNGYHVANAQVFTLADNAQIVYNMVDEHNKPVTITKVDENGNRVAGAELKLRDSEGNYSKTWTTDGKTDAVFTDLTSGVVYTVEEIKAPKGYEKAKNVSFKYDYKADGQVIKIVDKTVPKEDAKSGLPTDPRIFYATGSGLIAAGAILFVLSKRKKVEDLKTM